MVGAAGGFAGALAQAPAPTSRHATNTRFLIRMSLDDVRWVVTLRHKGHKEPKDHKDSWWSF